MKLTDEQELELEKSNEICKKCADKMAMTFREAKTRTIYEHQCQNCGSWGNKEYRHTKERIKRSIPWNQELYDAILKKKEEKRMEYEKRYSLYLEYLNSPKWKMLRLKRLTMDKMRCAVCGETAINVHHITYDRLYDENMEDLISLCKKCHEEIHGRAF